MQQFRIWSREIELPETPEEFTLYTLTHGSVDHLVLDLLNYSRRYFASATSRDLGQWLTRVQHHWQPTDPLKTHFEQFNRKFLWRYPKNS